MTPAFSTQRNWIALALISALLTMGVAQFIANKEVQTTAKRWQDTLTRAADTNAANVEAWLTNERESLVEAASNPSLQLYFLQTQDATADAAPPAQDYLTNYLTATSSKLGLQPATNPMIKNDELQTDGGVVLLDMDANTIAASQGLPALNAQWLDHVRNAPRGETTFIDISETSDGVPQMGYLVPVYGVQMDPSPEAQVGFLLSVIPVNQTLAALIASNPADSVQLLLTSGTRGVVNMDKAHPVRTAALIASRPIAGTPWTLVAETDKAAALGEVMRWRNTLLFAALFAALGIMAVAYAVWNAKNTRASVPLQSMNRLITLVSSLVDQRDPHASEHSAMVAAISRAIAEQMELSTRACDTTEMAAKLMNIGKANVSKELLTRTAELKPEELLTIRSSLVESADILEGIDLNGPVVDTLRQTQEYMNGTGPQKLRGKRILISARIISAVNAFVAMTSPRAYRAAMTPERALEVLAEDNGARFDPAVIAALNDYVSKNGATLPNKRTGPSLSIAS